MKLQKFNLPAEIFELTRDLPAATFGTVMKTLMTCIYEDEAPAADLDPTVRCIVELCLRILAPALRRARRAAERKAAKTQPAQATFPTQLETYCTPATYNNASQIPKPVGAQYFAPAQSGDSQHIPIKMRQMSKPEIRRGAVFSARASK